MPGPGAGGGETVAPEVEPYVSLAALRAMSVVALLFHGVPSEWNSQLADVVIRLDVRFGNPDLIRHRIAGRWLLECPKDDVDRDHNGGEVCSSFVLKVVVPPVVVGRVNDVVQPPGAQRHR